MTLAIIYLVVAALVIAVDRWVASRLPPDDDCSPWSLTIGTAAIWPVSVLVAVGALPWLIGKRRRR